MVWCGYVFHSYLKTAIVPQIENINVSADNTNLKKGESIKLKVDIYPESAKNNEIEFESDNNKVAVVDSDGNVRALRSGEATITVRAKENKAFGSITISVYTPVSGLDINTENLIIQVQDKFKIVPVIYPDDADNKKVLFKSENSEIASIDEYGNITGVKEGTTKVTVETEDSGMKKELSVKVIPKLQVGEVKFDESLFVNQNEISGLDINNNTVGKLKELVQSIYNVEIYNYKGELLSDDKCVGTGSTVKLVDDNNDVKMEYTIIIYGDVNGDGRINSIDLLVLQRHILEIQKLTGVFLKSGNINKNGKNPSSLDLLLIQRHILGLKYIQQ